MWHVLLDGLIHCKCVFISQWICLSQVAKAVHRFSMLGNGNSEPLWLYSYW